MEVLIWKVCISLVYVPYLYHTARCKKHKITESKYLSFSRKFSFIL